MPDKKRQEEDVLWKQIYKNIRKVNGDEQVEVEVVEPSTRDEEPETSATNAKTLEKPSTGRREDPETVYNHYGSSSSVALPNVLFLLTLQFYLK